MAKILALSLFLGLVNFSSETITAFNTNFETTAVCRNDEAVITCTTDSGLLRWAESDGNDDVTFNTGSTVGSIVTIGAFTIVLNSISSKTLSSTATSNVTSAFANGTSIDCLDGILVSAEKKTAVIYVADIPGPPKNFRNTSATFSSVTLSWSEPTDLSGVSITEYNIDIAKPTGALCPASQCSSLSPSTSSVTINELLFNTEYTFIIRATSCGGVGLNATLDIYLIGEAPSAPLAIESCISLVNKGKEMNLRVSWECPSVNEIRVPPISNYGVSVQSPSPLINPIDGISVPADCRCTYSASVPLEEVMNVMYTTVVSSNNSVGFNSQQTSLYSSANITTSTAQATISTALIAVFISWTACEGLSANVILTYYRLSSSLVESSVTSQVTLPVDTTFISVNNLLPGTGYGYTVSLRSNGGIVLGESAEGTFETTNTDDAVTITITETVCTSVTAVGPTIRSTSGQGTTTVNNDGTPTAGRFEECPATMNNSLLIGIGVLAAVAIVFLIMFIIVLCLCIRAVSVGKQRYSLNTVASTSPPLTPSSHGYELTDTNTLPPPPPPTSSMGMTTDMNMSYGHIYSSLKTSDSGKLGVTYEEINKTKPHLNNPSSPYEKDRPPIPVPYAEPVTNTTVESDYVIPDGDSEQNANNGSRFVDNPFYGKTQREEQQSPVNDEYLVVQ